MADEQKQKPSEQGQESSAPAGAGPGQAPGGGEGQMPGVGEPGADKPIIEQHELDALVATLEAVKSSPRVRRRASQGITISLFDFRHTVQLGADQLRRLETEFHNLCRVLNRTLVPYLNTDANVQVLSVGISTFDQFVRNFAPQPVLGIFRFDAHGPVALWEITPPLAFAVVEYMLGAPEPSPPPARELTSIEAALIARFYDEILSTWQLTWPVLEHLPLHVEQVVTSLAKVDMRQVDQHVVHVVIQAQVGSVEGAMNIGLPTGPLRALLRESDRLGQGKGAGAGSKQMQEVAARIGVSVAIELPSVEVPLRQLREVRVGSILPLGLPTTSNFIIRINGKEKFIAEGGLMDGQMAVRVEEALE